VNDIVKAIPDDESHFNLIVRQADILAQSQIVPSAYRRRSPDIIAAALAGRTFGWDAMTSLRNYHVIEGSASMKPEAMLGLVRQAGHSVQFNMEPGSVTAHGTRCDTKDQHTATFTMEDAEAAGLAGKRNWKQYQEAMLTWRAVSKLCRYLFPDVVLGAGYVPEELGAEVDPKGDIVSDEPWEMPPTLALTDDGLVTPASAKNLVLFTCGGDVEAAKEVWGDRESEALPVDTVHKLVAEIHNRKPYPDQSLDESKDGIILPSVEQPKLEVTQT